MIECEYKFEDFSETPKKSTPNKNTKIFVSNRVSYRIWENSIDGEKLHSSHTTLKITIPYKIRPLDRKRVMTTLTGMFLNSEYKNRLSSKLAEI